MTDHLDPQSRIDLISYKLDKARNTITESKYLADAEYFNTAINRLYYSVYYAASALMLSAGLEAATHKGIKNMLGLKFIHPGILPVEYGRIYQRLFDCRQEADYEDFVYYDKCTYDELLPLALKFIDTIAALVASR
ncbi:MAG: HEPN domain-containing protein [Duncaniella sp.]|nr:HEPN domain-containing protein [Duncaniella sp.]